MAREYRNFTREEKIKAVKMVLIDKKSQMEVERSVLGKKKCTGTINRWIREYIQEGEEILLILILTYKKSTRFLFRVDFLQITSTLFFYFVLNFHFAIGIVHNTNHLVFLSFRLLFRI